MATPHCFDAPDPSRKKLDLDALTLGSLTLLYEGNLAELSRLELPPQKILAWTRHLDRRQIEGLLAATLRRWHQLRRKESEDRTSPGGVRRRVARK